MDVQTHLHRARLERQLSLADLAARTALSVSVLQKIDAGRFGELPAGVYARAYVRAFAAEVGADPVETLSAVEELLPRAPDPFPVLRDVRSGPETTLHLQLARCSAAALDALGLLGAVVMPVVLLASWSSGVEVRALMADAGGALGAFCALPLALYFLLFDGIGGATPGCRAFGLLEPSAPLPLKLPQILKRAVSH
jgi:hypothetical protein